MKHLYKFFASIVLMSMMLVLTGCPGTDPEIIVTPIEKPSKVINTLKFKAANPTLSGDKAIEAKSAGMGGGQQNITWNITINGQTTTTVTTTNTTELPVMAGNEIVVTFIPSCDEETEANFTLPDGKKQKATKESPSFKWIVPDNVKSGDQIVGESEYETETNIVKQHGEITLILISI